MPQKPPRETNELASYILRVTTGEAEKIEPPSKHPRMKALSDKGASRGGHARAKKLSATKRKAIAKQAANARWRKSS